MKTYMKYLDANSPEYIYSRAIHDELDRIAMRCEEELVVSAAQLNELKERLDNKFECIRENRKLIWHGPLKKQSPRRHLDIAQRYMILFSDCILVCCDESGKKLEIKRELSMRAITVDMAQGGRTSVIQAPDQPPTGLFYYPFRVNAVEKSYEFLADKESDRETWVKKIRQASDDYNKRNTAIESELCVSSPCSSSRFFQFDNRVLFAMNNNWAFAPLPGLTTSTSHAVRTAITVSSERRSCRPADTIAGHVVVAFAVPVQRRN